MATGIWDNRGKNCECGGKAFSRIGRVGKMYCVICYRRIKKFGYFKRCQSDKNEIKLNNNYAVIYLYDRNGDKKDECLIDIEDINKIKEHKWHKEGRGYVSTKIKGKSVKLHQFLLGKKDGLVIDHINGNKLDNKKGNLRHITHRQNTWNNKKAKGYYFEKRRNKFVVRIQGDYYGGFEKENDAVIKINELRKVYFGEYASNR